MFPAACSRLAYVHVARNVVFPTALQTPALGIYGQGVVSAGRSDHVTCPRGDRSASIGPRAENDSSDSSGLLEPTGTQEFGFISKQITATHVRATDTLLTSLGDISPKS